MHTYDNKPDDNKLTDENQLTYEKKPDENQLTDAIFKDKLNDHYKHYANVTSVYDADTITVDIDLGFNLCLKSQKIRFYGINAIELRDPGGKEARDFIRELILNKEVILYVDKYKKGKYGRWVGIIVQNNININKLIVDKGHGIYHKY